MRYFLPENVFDAALRRIRRLYDEFPEVIVNYSGGKDSDCVLHLCEIVARERGRLPLNVLWIDQEAEWENVVTHVREVMHRPWVRPLWFQGQFKLFNATTTDGDPWLHCWDERCPDKWVRPKEPDSIHVNNCGTDRFKDLFDQFGRTYYPDTKLAMIAGVRCEESPARMNGLTCYATYQDITWGKAVDKGMGHYLFYPLYDWSYTDVWAAIHKNGWPYCNCGETPIWMGDYSFKRLDEVRVGDTVIGFTGMAHEERASKLTRSEVLAVSSRKAEVERVTLDDGRVIRCTADHQWLRKRGPNGNWKYGAVQIGDDLAQVVDPNEANPAHTPEGGWLGGLYDGEGHGDTIAQSRSHNPDVCARIEEVMTRLGIPYTVREQASQGADKFRMTGGRATLVRFVNACRPVRTRSLDKLILSGRFREKRRVVSIEPDGVDTVYSMQTTTGNYVAWGLASKNCKLYDLMWQHGYNVRDMRVSNVHHETAITHLRFIQEIEPRTWNKVCERLASVNAVRHLMDGYRCPEKLPPMFASWREYREHLLANLITEPNIRQTFRGQFDRWDKVFRIEDPRVEEDVVKLGISAILVNDFECTKYSTFMATHARDSRNHGKRGGKGKEIEDAKKRGRVVRGVKPTGQ